MLNIVVVVFRLLQFAFEAISDEISQEIAAAKWTHIHSSFILRRYECIVHNPHFKQKALFSTLLLKRFSHGNEILIGFVYHSLLVRISWSWSCFCYFWLKTIALKPFVGLIRLQLLNYFPQSISSKAYSTTSYEYAIRHLPIKLINRSVIAKIFTQWLS